MAHEQMSSSAAAQYSESDAEKPEGEGVLSADLIDDRALESVDQDEFFVEDVVTELGELVRLAKTPANVVLFGPWGSGKSSVKNLLGDELSASRLENSGVRYACVDAFKFSEVPLRRNFITQVAESLSLDVDKYRKRLYERHTTSDLTFTWDVVWRTGAFVVGALVVGALLVAVYALILATVGPGDFWPEFKSAFRGAATGIFVSATLAGAFVSLAGKGLVTDRTEDSPSTDEQFEQVFSELVTDVIALDRNERLIVFIDELDRASADQVARVLETLRTFLEIEGCVFIVAADQHVLENALTESARQKTPPDPANPYYSSGSAYLDKIFQYQLHLPPILPRRLITFAQNLTDGRGGLWAELPERDETVAVLVPTHVRSQRRVKILLNNFALAYRLAKKRALSDMVGGPIEERAFELAKLVCLQTEFPLFARDLLVDARLPDLVVAVADGDSDLHEGWPGLSDEVRQLARDYAAARRPVAELLLPPSNESVPDDAEAENQEDGGSELVEREHAEQLLRYLQRVSRVPSPRRDLIFLDASGSMFGLAPEFGDRLEDDALNGQADAVVEAISSLPTADRRQAFQLLAELLREHATSSVDAQNVARVLLAAAGAADDRT